MTTEVGDAQPQPSDLPQLAQESASQNVNGLDSVANDGLKLLDRIRGQGGLGPKQGTRQAGGRREGGTEGGQDVTWLQSRSGFEQQSAEDPETLAE
jgi:hypothetical protein